MSRTLDDALLAKLEGLPSDLTVEAWAAHIRANLPFGDRIETPTVNALSLAVRKLSEVQGIEANPQRIGLHTEAEIAQLTTSCPSLDWQILPEVACSPALNLALDEALCDAVATGERPPTLRFWGFDSPAIVLGRTQSLTNEVNLEECQRRNIAVVRRISGGGAMVVEPQRTITYSLILPESALVGLSVRTSYEVCDAWVVKALRSLNIDAHHVPINDIATATGKIGGAAQARRRGVILHHTTMAFDLDATFMQSILRIGEASKVQRGTRSAAKVVSPLRTQTELPREAIVERLMWMFQTEYGGTLDELRSSEWGRASRLVDEKYARESWTRVFE